eukprot:5359085-Prymnesium_polylepis.1
MGPWTPRPFSLTRRAREMRERAKCTFMRGPRARPHPCPAAPPPDSDRQMGQQSSDAYASP